MDWPSIYGGLAVRHHQQSLDPTLEAWSYHGCQAQVKEASFIHWAPGPLARKMADTEKKNHHGWRVGLYIGNLQVLWGMLERVWGCMLERVWGCMMATYRSYGACWGVFGAVYWSEFGAVGWQPAGLMGHVGAGLGLAWRCRLPRERVRGCILATYRSYGACWGRFGAVGWQPTSLMGLLERVLWLYVGKSCGARWSQFGAVCWQPTCPMGNIDVGRFEAVCWHYGACWGGFVAVCRHGECCLMKPVGRVLGGVCWQPWGVLEGVWGYMLATYRSCGACWTGLGLHIGNLQVSWWVWDCVLANYRSNSACWSGFGAVCCHGKSMAWNWRIKISRYLFLGDLIH